MRQLPRLLSLISLVVLQVPLTAWSEPADIYKYRHRGEGVIFEIATPPDPCVKIVQRGEFSAAAYTVNKLSGAPTASFFLALENICSNDRLVAYGQVAAPALVMTVVGSGKTVVLRGTLPITTESLVSGAKTSEQVIFDLVLTAGSDGLRRRHGAEHLEMRDRGLRTTLVYDQREYVNVSASGSLSGTIAGLPVNLGNVGNFVIQSEQDRSMQIQKF